MSDKDKQPQGQNEDEELDDWDQRIYSTGCASMGSDQIVRDKINDLSIEEQLQMNDCYYDKKDWRACAKEMQAFRECWKRKGNEERTQSKTT